MITIVGRLARVVLLIASVVAMSRHAGAEDGRSEVTSGRLPNGLRVIVEVDRREPRVAVAVSYEVGQRDDPRGNHGLAHLTEHLMFEGSANVADDGHFKALEGVGGSDIGAFVTLDHSVYHQEVPRRAWRRALWLESDRMAYLLSTLDADRLDRQREVVRNEWRLRKGHGRIGERMSAIYELLYVPSHPYHPVRQSLDNGWFVPSPDIDRIALADVQWFFQRYYRPSRATVAVVGDVDPAEVMAEVERYFGPIQAIGPDPERPRAPAWTRSTERVGKVQVRDPRSGVVVAWAVPPPQHGDAAALGLVADHLGSMRGPLYPRLLEQGLLAKLSTGVVASELGSLFVVDMVGPESANTRAMVELVDAALDALRQQGLNDARMRALTQGAVVRLEHRAESLVARAKHLVRRGEPLHREVERIQALRASDLSLAASRWLVPRHRGVLTVARTRVAGSEGRLDVE